MTRIDKGLTSTPVETIDQPDAVSALGTLWGKTTGIFALSSFGILGLGLLNVAILTRFLDPSAYGELGILLFFSGLLTVFYNLGSVQGVFSLVFGSAGEEDMDDADVGAAGNQRRALGTGLFFAAIVALLGTALIAAAATPIAGYLLGNPDDADLVILAAASGGIASVVRLATNVVRMERRPRTFSALLAARPALALAAAIPLVVAGGGVGGVLLGFVIGNALALVISVIAAWRSYEFGFDRSLLPEVLKRGALFIPVAVGFWVIQNVDLFLLSRYVPAAEIGYYRLAGRVAGLGYHLSSAFLMAWGPLRLTSTFKAVEEHRGSSTVRGEILAYFIFAGLWLVLGLAVSAHALVRIAPDSYDSAAPLIPLLGAGAVAHGVMVVTYRSSKFPRRRQRYPVIVLAAAALFIPLAIWLIVAYGATGAAVSGVIVFLLGTLAVSFLSQRGPDPIDFQYRRIAMALLSAGLCLGLAFAGDLAGDLAGDPWRYLVDAAAVIGYPVLLVVTGALPRLHLDMVWQVSRVLVPIPWRRSAAWRPSLEELDAEGTSMLELAVRHRRSPRELADQFGQEEPEVHRRLVYLLRTVASVEAPNGERAEADHRIGLYLFSEASPAERDAAARSMYAREVTTPGEIDALERALESLRAIPPSDWETD